MKEFRVVVLGSGGVGKSALTIQFVQNIFLERYDPTIEDSYRKLLSIDNLQIVLEILDTAGTEQFTAMRDLYLKNGQGFVVVFSIASESSYKELDELREQLLRVKDAQTIKDIPVVLAGNKCDLVEDRAITMDQAVRLSRKWDSSPLYETSARRKINVDEVFIDLSRQMVKHEQLQNCNASIKKQRRQNKCTIL